MIDLRSIDPMDTRELALCAVPLLVDPRSPYFGMDWQQLMSLTAWESPQPSPEMEAVCKRLLIEARDEGMIPWTEDGRGLLGSGKRRPWKPPYARK